MPAIEKVQIASHALCCCVYALLFWGPQWEGLYVIAALAYGAITVCECRR